MYWKNIGRIIDLYDVCQIRWNELIWVGVIWIDVNQVGIFVIPNYTIFAPNFFNFKIIFALSIFEIVVASKVFAFNSCCTIPQWDPVCEIQRPDYGVKDNTVDSTVRLWDCGYDGYLWVHPSAVINITTKLSALNISSNIQTTKEEVLPITVSPYGCLFGVDNCWLNIQVVPIRFLITEGVRNSYWYFFRTFYLNRQWYLRRSFCDHIHRGNFPSGVVSSFGILER